MCNEKSIDQKGINNGIPQI